MTTRPTHRVFFAALPALAAAAALVSATLAPSGAARAATHPKVVILGIDGMDPQLLRTFAEKGVMPHFKRLMTEGSFRELGTSVPPQSPVAWSNFITGMDPGGHGIFDFIHRDPKTYLPVFSTAEIGEPDKVAHIGDWVIPMSKGQTLLLRKGEAFWQILDKHHVPYTIFRVPANFPPARSDQQTLSGMGTPDLLGTYGTFSFFTDDSLYFDVPVSGGEVFPVRVEDGVVRSAIVGPTNSLRKDRPTMKAPFSVYLDTENGAARIDIQDESFILEPGKWSDWVRLKFPIMGRLKSVAGITRFYLRSIAPYVQLYATPVNLDPSSPALPISTPSDYAEHVYDRIGYFYTQGMPEDTKALEYGMLSDSEFVSQTDNVLTERWRMLKACMDEYTDGFLFFYVSTIDQSCHALWRNVDAAHPAHTEGLSFADRFEQLYVDMDEMLGSIVERLSEDATLIVMSDHGFAPYYKKFNLNSWLYQNGYLTLVRPKELGQHVLLGNVFWRRTKAYAIGINGLYINELGREGKGIVRPGEQRRALIDEISRKLLAVRDPDTGAQVITTVYKTGEIYHGDQAKNAPDLIVGYNRGYRCSDESALGTLTPEVLVDNLGKWTGDHCMDHHLVPGVVLSNRPIFLADPDLKDMAPTILGLYGIAPPPQMHGRVLFSGMKVTGHSAAR